MRKFLVLIMSLCFVSCEKQSEIVISDDIKTFRNFRKKKRKCLKIYVNLHLEIQEI